MPSSRRIVALSLLLPFVGILAAACISGAGPALPPEPEPPSPTLDLSDDAGAARTDATLGDPFALDGLSPSHGPFSGGTRTRLNGRGFSSKLRVFVGSTEITGSSLIASDPSRAAIIMPPGAPGFVDVRIVDPASAKERILKDGFYYDAVALLPDSGATSGGTRIAITGSGTAWTSGTTVSIGGLACSDVYVASPTKLECITPPSTLGSKDVVVSAPNATPLLARDAYTYSDSDDGYRGGLSGGVLSGRVKVLAYDALTGTPLSGAFAVAGDNLATAKVATTNASGVVEINGIEGATVTVSVAAKCHSPMTFIDVPVDTVTVYLGPVLEPACAGPPGSFPQQQRSGGIIEGDLVFPGSGEFGSGNWSTVPLPTKPTERRAAYAFSAARFPDDPFTLPDASQATTPDGENPTGTHYSLSVLPGNNTIYVLAGIEDRSVSPAKFVPYAMGVARGIPVAPNTKVEGVDVKVDILFDHQVTLAPKPPAPAARGPDRFSASIATTLGAAGYALLPRGQRLTSLPPPENLSFVGVPALNNALAGEQYVLGGVAATGYERSVPASIVGRVLTTTTNAPVTLGGFLDVPVLGKPGAGVWNGTHVAFSGVSGPADLTIVDVTAGGGMVDWLIVAPGLRSSFNVPDLSSLPGPDRLGLVHGSITSSVYVARIEQFDYARLRFGQINSRYWNAYTVDRLAGVY